MYVRYKLYNMKVQTIHLYKISYNFREEILNFPKHEYIIDQFQ